MARPTNPRMVARKRRQAHVRKRTLGTSVRPRLSVFRSNGHIYAQVIDDHAMGESATTLTAVSSLEKELRERKAELNKRAMAREVGKLIAARCIEKGVKSVVFDRNGYLYHGRVKALAEGAREGGLEF